MLIIKIFDYLSVAGLIFISYGTLLQWYHILKNKSAKDILTQDVMIRWIITLVLLVKVLFVGDIYLIIGQSIWSVAISIYALTLLYIKSSYKK